MAQGLERIPLAVDSDFKAQPVRANFPEQAATDFKLVSFEPDQPAPTPVPASDSGNVLSDSGRLLKMGANTAAQDVRELTGRIPVVGPSIQSGLDWVDAKTHGGKSSDALLKEDNAAMQSGMSKPMQTAMDKKWWDQDKGTFGDAWSDPRAYQAGVLQSLPEQALMMFPAMRLAKGAYAAKIAAGATPEIASLSAARTAQVAGTVIEGSLGGAQSSRQVRDDILDPKKITDEMLGQSEAFKTLLSQGMTPAQARKTLAESQASRAFVTAGVATGLFGGMGDRFLAKIITGSGHGMAKRFVMGAASEGIAEEFPQSYLQQVAQNEAMRGANPKQSLTDDALNQAFGGMAAGGLQGGGMAAVFGHSGPIAHGRPKDAIPASDSGAGPGGGGITGEFIPAEPMDPGRGLTDQSQPGTTYDQNPPALPPGQLMLPRLALPAPEEGGPTLRQMNTAVGLLKHSPRASPELLQRLMRVDQTMATMLFNHWQGQTNGEVAGGETTQLSAQSDQGQGADGAGSGVVGSQLPGAVPSAVGAIAAESVPDGGTGMAVGATGADAITPLDVQAHGAATSPYNATPQPTEAQKQAGNYKVGRIKFQGMDISIENPAGSVRTGKDASGREWQTDMQHHYGYIKGTIGKDKSHLDVFIKPGAQSARIAYVIDQIDPKTGVFDEHKIVFGADSEDDAKAIYHANYEQGWDGMGAITAMPMDQFKDWIKSEKTTKPLAYAEPKEIRTATRTPTAPPQSDKAITHTKSGKLEISGFTREDVAQSLKTAKIKAAVAVGNDGKILVTAVSRSNNPAPMSVKESNAIKTALMGKQNKPPKARQFTGNLRNDVNLLVPGLYAEVARGGDGEAMDGVDLSLVAESLRDQGFMLPTTETGKDSDAVIELIRQDIANGGGTLNERRQLEAMTEAELKAHRADVLRLADEYGIQTKKGVIPRALTDIEADLATAIEAEADIAAKSLASVRDQAIKEGIPADEVDAIADHFADLYDADTAKDKFVLMYRDAVNAIQERIDGDQGRKGRDGQGESAVEHLPAQEGSEGRPTLELAGQSAEEIRAEQERVRQAEAQAHRDEIAAERKARAERDKAEKDRRAADVIAEDKARRDAEVAALQNPDDFQFGADAPAAPAPVIQKVSTEKARGQGDIFAPALSEPGDAGVATGQGGAAADTIAGKPVVDMSDDQLRTIARGLSPTFGEAAVDKAKTEINRRNAALRDEKPKKLKPVDSNRNELNLIETPRAGFLTTDATKMTARDADGVLWYEVGVYPVRGEEVFAKVPKSKLTEQPKAAQGKETPASLPSDVAKEREVGDVVKLTKPGVSGRINIVGTITKIFPDGKLEVRTQQDGYMTVAESELGHKPKVSAGETAPPASIAGKPVSEMSDGMLNQIAKSSQPAAEKAKAEVARREQAQEFIKAPDGSSDFGEITADQANAMKRQAGKIRLERGIQNADGTGYGLEHIEANHGKQIRGAGFGSVEEFVAHVAKDFGQVWQATGSQVLVAYRDGEQHMMYVQLEPAKDEAGDYYRVNSAFPVRQSDYPEKHGFKKLWDGSEPASTVAGKQPAFAGTPETESGQDTPNARGQSEQNIADQAGEGKQDQARRENPNIKTTLAEHDATMDRLRDETATLAEYKAAFQRLQNSTEELTAEFAAMKKDDILKHMGGQRAHNYKSDTKDKVVAAAVRDLMDDFSIGRGISYVMGGRDAYANADRAPLTRRRERIEREADGLRQKLRGNESTEFDNQKVYIAFDPAQIKSAISNTGEFSDTNPSILESRTNGEGQEQTASTRAIQSVVDKFLKQFAGASELTVRVARTVADIPARFRPSPFAEGVFHDDAGLIYLVTMNLKHANGQVNTGRVWQVLMHEAVGHFGLAQMMGDRFKGILKHVMQAAKAKGNVTDDIYQPGHQDYATVEAVRLRYPDASDEEVAQEVLARMAETDPGRTLFGYVRAVVRQWLRDMARAAGVALNVTTAELNDMVAQASHYMRRGDNMGTETMPSGVVMASKTKGMESRSHVSGDSGRQYTAEQQRTFANIGREVVTPTLKERVTSIWQNVGKKMTQGIVDQFAPLKDIDQHAYLLARMSKAADGALEALMLYGKVFLRDGVYDVNIKDGGVIDKLLAPLGAEADDFMWWVAGNRADTLTKESASARAEGARLLNQASVLDYQAKQAEADAKQILQQAGNFSKHQLGSQRQQKANAQQAEALLREAKRLYREASAARTKGNSLKDVSRENLMTPDDIKALKDLATGKLDFDYKLPNGTTTRDRATAFKAAQEIFSEFNKSVMDVAEESGLIDGAARSVWEREFYVPFYREMEGDKPNFPNVRSGLVRQKAFERLKGGTEKLNSDLLANTIKNWSHLLNAASKNRAAKATLEAAENVGAATWIPAAEKGSVFFRDQGEEFHYRVEDPFVLDAVTALEFAGFSGPAMSAMGAFKRWLTMGVTANPAFKIRNLIRDSVQAIGTAEMSYNPLTNLREGFASTSKESQTYASMLASGGHIRFGTMIEGNRASNVRRLVEQGVAPGTILDSESKIKAAWNRHIMPLVDAYNELGDRSENINRAAIYEQLRAKGMNHADASLQARDLMDFSMGGTWAAVRFLTQTVPFANARLQGLYKVGRAAKEDPRRFGYVVGAVALASLALLGAYHDDEDWKKREDWDRDNYWWFKVGGMAFRIPKPFEIGSIGTLAERSAELLFEKEMDGHRFGQRLVFMASNTFSMNPVPQMLKPIFDVYSNKDSFTGRPIEGMGMERLRPEDRFTMRSSEFAKLIGKAGVISPLQVDQLIRGYFGWLGTAAVTSVDQMVRVGDGTPRAAMQLRDAFLVGNFVETLPSGSSRYVTQMYEQSKEVEQAYASWKSYLKSGNKEKADEIYADNKDKINRYRLFENIKRSETAMNEQTRRIEADKNMSGAAKRVELDKIAAQKDKFSRSVIRP